VGDFQVAIGGGFWVAVRVKKDQRNFCFCDRKFISILSDNFGLFNHSLFHFYSIVLVY